MVRQAALSILATASAASAFVATPISLLNQIPFGTRHNAAKAQCELPPVLDPKDDGLPSAHELFGSSDALKKQVERHQALVRVPSICFDDLGDFDEDKRWLPFYDVHDVLEETYPKVYVTQTKEQNPLH